MSLAPTTALPSRPSPGAAGAHLGRLYADHSRMVYGICRMLLRDPNEAEDATQQVFLSAYRSLLTGTDVREPAAWLGTIARNACRQRAVSRMREPLAVADDEITLVSPGVEETAIGREEVAALYAELGHLPAKQREAVVLRDLYGLRYDEVAKALGTSRPAVEALLFRGRRRLQRRLRPGIVAGVLVVPLAVQESIAYAVPGFASTVAPAGAIATAAGIPLLAKLAAGGAAIGIAGSAGVVAERSLHDPPARPAETRMRAEPERVEAVSRQPASPLRAASAAPRPLASAVSDTKVGDVVAGSTSGGGRAARSATGDGEHENDEGHDGDVDKAREDDSGSGSGSGGEVAAAEADDNDAEDEPADVDVLEERDRPDGPDQPDEVDDLDDLDEPDDADELGDSDRSGPGGGET